MNRRPAFLTVFHKAWIALATAVLLASCTVVPAPTSYSYQQMACPPGMTAQAAPPPANAAPAPAPAPNGQLVPAPAACYTAVPNGYTYNYYPSAYPAYPAYGYGYPYSYYGPAYYGPTVGVGLGWGWGGGWHHRH